MGICLEMPRQKITVVSATFPRLLLHSQLRLQVYAERATWVSQERPPSR